MNPENLEWLLNRIALLERVLITVIEADRDGNKIWNELEPEDREALMRGSR